MTMFTLRDGRQRREGPWALACASGCVARNVWESYGERCSYGGAHTVMPTSLVTRTRDRARCMALAIAATTVVAAPLPAQRLSPSPWAVDRSPPPLLVESLAPDSAGPAAARLAVTRDAARRRPPSPAPYLVGGVVAGAGLAALVIANAARHCDDCMMFPIGAIEVAGIGVVGGVAAGGIVYLVRRSVWDAQPRP